MDDERHFLMTRPVAILTVLGVAMAMAGAGCKKNEGGAAKKITIQNIGSDTMVNLAQAWAEEYSRVDPSISIEVSGGGSGIGIAALINGTADVANASRRLEPGEVEKAKKNSGKEPQEFMVGYDGLAIYVHKDNPLEEITLEQLREIYKEGGTIDTWSQLGVKSIPGAKGEAIVRVSRQNNSGTYAYFREVVLNKGDYKPRSMDMNGSKEVVETVGRTPTAIGYSGLGYATAAVKILKVAKKAGDPAVKPSIPTVLDKSYPIARPLFMYTPGEPPPHVKKYLDWIHSDAGQKVVETSGYVPLPKS
jgi:phosphate transport system substrate-binding protein